MHETTAIQVLGIVFILALALCFAIQFGIQIYYYFNAKCNALPIKFSQFKALYAISTNWELCDNYVLYRYFGTCTSDSGFTYHPTRTAFFYFSLPDLIRYHRFKKGLDDAKTRKENTDKIEAVIKQWQIDLKNFNGGS